MSRGRHSGAVSLQAHRKRRSDQILIGAETLADLLSRHKGGKYHHASALQTVPPKTDLSGVLLADSDLSGLNLSDVNLTSSDLSNADLQKTKLVRADLREANLADADLRGADLTDADFREASLAGANLRDGDEPMRVAGMLLGGADLSNAKLPPQIPLDADLESARDAAEAVNNIFLVLATAIAYCALTIVTTTDDKLVPDASLALIPLIQTSVPIRNFFQYAPIAVILVSVYLQFNLVQFFRTAALLPGRFPDGAALSERVSHWALSALLLRWHGRPASSGASRGRSARVGAFFVFWCAAPLEIVLLWLRYLACHDVVGNLVLSSLTLLSILIAGIAYRAARAGSRGEAPFAGMKPSTALTFLLVLAVSGVAMAGVSRSSAMGADLGIAAANFRNREVSARPEKWDEQNPMEVRGAKLADANLAHARAHLAFLAHADLRRAVLTSADFKESDLRGAILQGSDLAGANFEKARLEKATLEDAAFLPKELEKSACSQNDKSPDHFQLFAGADLTEARFSKGARICHVSFHGATLTGTYLDQVKLPHADLGETVLKETHLSGAILEFADLQNAHLVGTDLRDSDLKYADLKGAEVNCPNADGAHLEGAIITPEQLRQIHTDLKTTFGSLPRVKSKCK